MPIVHTHTHTPIHWIWTLAICASIASMLPNDTITCMNNLNTTPTTHSQCELVKTIPPCSMCPSSVVVFLCICGVSAHWKEEIIYAHAHQSSGGVLCHAPCSMRASVCVCVCAPHNWYLANPKYHWFTTTTTGTSSFSKSKHAASHTHDWLQSQRRHHKNIRTPIHHPHSSATNLIALGLHTFEEKEVVQPLSLSLPASQNTF